MPTDSLGTAWVRLVQNALSKAMPLSKYLSSGNNRCRYSAALEGMKPTLPPGSRICSQSPVRPITLTCVRRRTCAITALVLSGCSYTEELSTYAAYNGGPNAYNRWRRPDESADARYIDQSFLTKFRAVNAGQLFDILSCAAQWGRPSLAAQAPHATPTASPK
jgi:hypothetical protein